MVRDTAALWPKSQITPQPKCQMSRPNHTFIASKKDIVADVSLQACHVVVESNREVLPQGDRAISFRETLDRR